MRGKAASSKALQLHARRKRGGWKSLPQSPGSRQREEGAPLGGPIEQRALFVAEAEVVHKVRWQGQLSESRDSNGI